jgi:hypothetical protein
MGALMGREPIYPSLQAFCHFEMLSVGYATIMDAQLGYGPAFRKHLLTTCGPFLRPEHMPGVFPPQRQRACDAWLSSTNRNGGVSIARKASSALVTPPDTAGNHPHGLVRDYSRVPLSEDPWVVAFFHDVLALVPGRTIRVSPTGDLTVDILPPKGEVRIDVFRIEVGLDAPAPIVSGPHSDGAKVVIFYCLEKDGLGAITTLHDLRYKYEMTRVKLRPGQILIACDRSGIVDSYGHARYSWLHSVTDLMPAPGRSKGHRTMFIAGVS